MNDQPQNTILSERNINLLLVMLPVLTGGMYLLGTTFYTGWLSGYGLSEEVFPLSRERSVLAGFFSFLTLSGVGLGYWIFSAVVLVIFVLIAQVLTLSSLIQAIGAWIKVKFKGDNKKADNTDGARVVEYNLLERVLGYSAMFLVAVFAVIGFIFYSAGMGREQAMDEREKFANHKLPVTTALGGNDTELVSGYLITCSDKFCAFWTGEQPVMIRVDDIKRMDPKRSSNTATDKQKE